MKDKELPKYFNENEFGRLRDILFPKKTRKQPEKIPTLPKPKQQQKPSDLCIKDEIQKLRNEIYNKLEKDRNVEEPQIETQRLYLNGINKLSSNLKDYTRQISSVFQDFLEHLPTNLYLQKKNYNNHYFVSLLIQNCVWSKLDGILKKPLIEGFKGILTQNAEIKEERQLEKSIKSKRILRQRNKTLVNINKYFSIWRFQSRLIGMQSDCQHYRKENCLQNDRKVLQSMLNFPLYVLLVQQLNKQNADICEILLFDEKSQKLCKFIDESTQVLNTSLQTVTQRSLLHGETSKNKIKRHELEVNLGLTKLCIERKQILFVSNLQKHPDYHQLDSFCNWQLSDFNKLQYSKGGAVFYPIISSANQTIGILRQYFFEKSLKALPNDKINKISLLLQVGGQMQKQTRKLSNESELIRQKYYLKMILLIKKLESEKGNLHQIMVLLAEELKSSFQIEDIALFKVEKKQNKSKVEILLNCVWGKNEECTSLLSIVDRLLKQGINHLYLQKRLIIYHNMMLFDLHIGCQKDQQAKGALKRLPVELLSVTIGKVQTIITKKEEELQEIKRLELKLKETKVKQQQARFQAQFQTQSLVFLAHYAQVYHPFEKIVEFVEILTNKYVDLFPELQEPQQTGCFLQILEKGQKKMRIFHFIAQKNIWQECESFRSQVIRVKINEIVSLVICCSEFSKETKLKIQRIISQFIQLFLKEKQKRNAQKGNFLLFESKAAELLKICRVPQRQFHQISKSNWQLSQLKLIYKTFQSIVQLFVSQLFGVNQQVVWQKQEPNTNTFEEWKQIIYQFVFTQFEKIEVAIKATQENQALKAQKQLQFLSPNLPLVQNSKQSFLQIFVAKNKVKYKCLHYESPIIFKLSVNLSEADTEAQNMKTSLSVLKLCWIKLCKSLIQGASKIDQRNMRKNVLRLTNYFSVLQTAILNEAFSKMKQIALKRKQRATKIDKMLAMINKKQQQCIWQIFLHLIANNTITKQEKRLQKITQKPFSILKQVLNNKIFREPFQNMHKLFLQSQRFKHSLPIIAGIISVKQKELRWHAFTLIFLRSKSTKTVSLLISPLRSILKKDLDKNWREFIQRVRQTTRSPLSKEKNPEQVRSLKQLKSIIQKQASQYHLFLIINSFNCLPLYSSSHKDSIVALQQVNVACYPFLVYQIGSEGQFIWHYSLKEGQNSFKVKDKLSRLSKFLQQALKNCKQLFLLNVLRLKCFRSKYFQFWKSKYFKKWRQECDILGIQQRNRLNDCLYQLNIESQTTKEKLKMFEKMLKGNVLMFEEMKAKREQYLNSIKFSETEVTKIDQSYDKLENARNMFTMLYKRTILKSCVLVWRSNSKRMLLMKKEQKKVHLSLSKIGLKTIFSIFQPKIGKILRKVFQTLSSFKKSNIKKRQVERINVSFEQNSRLITFQSELNQKQNESEHSNSFESPQGKKETYRNITKFKLNQMKESNRVADLSAQQISKYNNGAYKLNPKTLKFLKRMGKLCG